MMKMKVLFLLLLGYSRLLAANVDETFLAANKAYQNNQFSQAIEQYESLVSQGYYSVELYYNLGNSYFKKNKMGKAILYYERALLLDEDNEDVLYNLSIARGRLQDELSELPPFFLARWWGGLRKVISASGWAVAGLLFFWLGIGGIIVWLLAGERQRKKQGFVIGVIALFLSLVPFTLSVDKTGLEKRSQRAILMASEIPLRSAPDAESTELLILHEGTKLELLDKIGDWSKVRLVNGEQGWLPDGAFEEI